MIKNFLRDHNGFSLVEILVVIALVAVFTTGAALLFSSGSAAWFSTEGHMRLQENMRKVMQRVAQELRQTSGVQIISSNTIRFSIPIICIDAHDDSQTLICQEPENFAQTASNFSVKDYYPTDGEIGNLVEGDSQVVHWNFSGRSQADPLIIYYDLGSDEGDTQYAIRAGAGTAAPKMWCYQESDVYPGVEGEGSDVSLCLRGTREGETKGDWTTLGGNSDEDLSWVTGELKIFGSGIGTKQYRRLVIEESHDASELEMREIHIINDELIWGAPLQWGCTDSDCMEENYVIEYTVDDDRQFVRSIFDNEGNLVRSDIWATDISDIQFSLVDNARLVITMTSEVVTSQGRVLTSQTEMDVYLRN